VRSRTRNRSSDWPGRNEVLQARSLAGIATRGALPRQVGAGHWLDGARYPPPGGSDNPTRTAMAISGDGRFIVYSAVKENPGTQDKPRLYLRRLDQLEAKPIAGTEGASTPFFRRMTDGWAFSSGWA